VKITITTGYLFDTVWVGTGREQPCFPQAAK